MNIEEKLITPYEASRLLSLNTKNRTLDANRVNKYVDEMKNGKWIVNGDTIKITASGRLIDGQHRLSAIEKSGIPQKYIIVSGLDDDSFVTIDTGKARIAATVLQLEGLKNPNIYAAVAKLILIYNKTGNPFHFSHATNPTHADIVQFVSENDRLHLSIDAASRNKKHFTPSLYAFCHYQFGFYDQNFRDAFFSEMEEGEFSFKNSPVKYLRDYLLLNKSPTTSYDKMFVTGLIYKAFKLYIAKKETKVIRLPNNKDEWLSLP